MTRGEITGRKPRGGQVVEIPHVITAVTEGPISRLTMTIQQFCEAHNISVSMYYKLRTQDRGPLEMRIGTRTLITVEAAAKWRAERQADVVATAETKAATRKQVLATQRTLRAR